MMGKTPQGQEGERRLFFAPPQQPDMPEYSFFFQITFKQIWAGVPLTQYNSAWQGKWPKLMSFVILEPLDIAKSFLSVIKKLSRGCYADLNEHTKLNFQSVLKF